MANNSKLKELTRSYIRSVGPASSYTERVQFLRVIADRVAEISAETDLPASELGHVETTLFVTTAVNFLLEIADRLAKSQDNPFLQPLSPKKAKGLERSLPDIFMSEFLGEFGTILMHCEEGRRSGSIHQKAVKFLWDLAYALQTYATSTFHHSETCFEINAQAPLDITSIFQLFSDSNYEKAAPLPNDIERRIIAINGTSYLCVPDAAEAARVPLRSFRNWIKKGVEINGIPLRAIFIDSLDRHVVTVEAVRRTANRFVRLPSQELAQDVTFADNTNQTGYIGMKDAAAKLGIARITMNVWASDYTKSPLKRHLDVIKCSVSGHLYIHSSELNELSQYVPKTGLSRGPRPQFA